MKPAVVLGFLTTAMTTSLLISQMTSQSGGPPQDFPSGRVDPWDENALAGDASIRRPAVIYTWSNAPASPSLNNLPLKRSVSQYGITWTFAKPERVGQFINDDWYVVGPVTIEAIDPRPLYGGEISESQVDPNGARRPEGQRVCNGFMLNPPAAVKVSYDSGVRNWFEPSLIQKLPIAMKPRDSLVSTISMPNGSRDPSPIAERDRARRGGQQPSPHGRGVDLCRPTPAA